MDEISFSVGPVRIQSGAQKYLNVCILEKDGNGGNCSRCTKCARTIITLEAMGKLEQFKDVFDLDVWHKEAFRWKCWYVAQRKDAKPLALEAAKYARERGMSLLPRWLAIIVRFVRHHLVRLKILK